MVIITVMQISECWCQPGGTTGDFDVTNNTDCYDAIDAHPNQQSFTLLIVEMVRSIMIAV